MAKKESGGARLDGFLAESHDLSEDLQLRHFAKHYQVSGVKSWSGQPPDRAQICSFDVVISFNFFSEPVSGPPKVNLRHRNKKKSVKNVDRTRTEASN